MSPKSQCIADICEFPPLPWTLLQALFKAQERRIFRQALTKSNWFHYRPSITPMDFHDYLINRSQMIENWFHFSNIEDASGLNNRRLSMDSKKKVYFSYGYSGLNLSEICEPRTESIEPYLPTAYYIFRLCHQHKSIEDCIWTICRIPQLQSKSAPAFILPDCEYEFHRKNISADNIRDHLIKHPNLLKNWLSLCNNYAQVYQDQKDKSMYVYYGPRKEKTSSDCYALVAEQIIDLCDLVVNYRESKN